jgi:ferredoxin-NADP reductase/nitrite reductase/ring-hydroxylating ferredoxin subunit
MSASRKVANKKDFNEGDLKRVEIDGKLLVLARVKNEIYAMDAVCSHEGGPLEDGTIEGYELKCPWHYAVFDVRNAKVSDKTVWATDLHSYPTQVDEASGDISVKLEQVQKEETTTQQKRSEEEKSAEAQENDRKFYEEEERKASHKLTLKLLAKERLEGTDIMTFKLERAKLDYSAGQFGYFKLDGVTGDPKGPIRHFSLASSPTEPDYLLISTRIRETPYKRALASLEIGSKIQAWGPQGEFVLHDDHSKPAVFLSGGIGVTPFRSMIKYATDKQLPLKIVMFDSNRNEQNILYKNEFDSWAAKNKNLRAVYAVTDDSPSGWMGEKGRIDKAMINKQIEESELKKVIFYVCGPPGMLKAMQELLQGELQVPKERIKIEEFTGY